MPKKKAAQLELFAAAGEAEIHALGILGWKDPLWTTRFSIPLLDGHQLYLNLITIRRLQDCALPARASGANAKPNQ